MGQKSLVGISACLLGECVRYDGGDRLDHCLTETLGKDVAYLPVCPEVECGMSIPREPIHLVETSKGIRLLTRHREIDKTGQMQKWVRQKIRILSHLPLCGFIFKSKSPSCALSNVRVCRGEAVTRNGTGLFAQGFTEAFPLLPVAEEIWLHGDRRREKFIEQIFAVKGKRKND